MEPTQASTYRLGVDAGGTFTDLIIIDNNTGEIQRAKVPSTPEDPSSAVLDGIELICRKYNVNPGTITQILHGTTVATNSLVMRNGARVGLVTTQGYRQILHVARSQVPGGIGGWVIWDRLEPLASLEMTVEARERIGTEGQVLVPLDEAGIRRKLEHLADAGIEALTISLINAYTNPTHERQIRDIAHALMPGIPVSISSEVLPEMQEYERTVTTVVNSYVHPVISRYLRNLKDRLTEQTSSASLHILRSDGGLMSGDLAAQSPVNLLLSGPAGGVTGSLWVARQIGLENILTFDMGGTSTDVSMIKDGVPQTRRETSVGEVSVRAPSIDVRSVGAGGGSIAYVPELTKALRVGPRSAGAVPGPAAYGRGGKEPTVTDACVVLGYLPDTLKLGETLEIDRPAAEKAVGQIATALDISLKEAAEGIISIVTENMLGALRLASVVQGVDPRDFALMAFGGAGPMFANQLARLLSCWPAIVPPGPGVLCAYGAATTRMRSEASQTFVRRIDHTCDEEVAGLLKKLAQAASADLANAGSEPSELETIYQTDVRYVGQGNHITLEFDSETFHRGGLQNVVQGFDDRHDQLFTFVLDEPHELVNLRAIVQGPAPKVSLPEAARSNGDPVRACIQESTIHIRGEDLTTPIYDRALLHAEDRVPGPAIIHEMDATTLILPEHVGEVDRFGNIIINPLI
ncbi:MAG: hydantoinase/oxoprolinase family protein [Saprospiraceae bacterium]|nr:hydantoinase/oxoprolinase family protein [Saprospiraceae bacterium]